MYSSLFWCWQDEEISDVVLRCCDSADCRPDWLLLVDGDCESYLAVLVLLLDDLRPVTCFSTHHPPTHSVHSRRHKVKCTASSVSGKVNLSQNFCWFSNNRGRLAIISEQIGKYQVGGGISTVQCSHGPENHKAPEYGKPTNLGKTIFCSSREGHWKYL